MTRKSKKKPQKSYRYEPLEDDESIRLLQLLPGKGNKRIQCRLITANVDDCLPYEAISYVWGKANDKTKVLCHGKLVKIPTNLLHALQRFRREKEPRILWADSICINQRDLVERRKQVQIMGTIFENANRVLVWLGRDLHFDANPAFDLVKALTPFCRDLRYPVTEDQEANFVSNIERFPSSQWSSLHRVLSNPWFSRIWVLQEISLAKAGLVTYGQAQIAWDDLRTTARTIDWAGRASPLTYLLASIQVTATIDFRSNRPRADLLDNTRNFNCSDPRDKIYALLAHNSFRNKMSTSTSESSIPIDYSLPYSKIYFATAKWLLQTSYDPFMVLSLVGHTRETIQDLEVISWVPQWNIPYHGRTLGLGLPSYSASGNLGTHYLLKSFNLEVQGIQFDCIKWQSHVLEPQDFKLSEVDPGSIILKNIWKQVGTMGQGMLNEEEMLQRFCLTLNAGNWRRGGSRHRTGLSKEQRVADCIAFFEAAGINLASKNYLKDKYGPGNRFRFFETTCVSRERRFFVTERGYCGIGPEVSLEGDNIAVIFGADVPFVLWEQKTGGFRLCGECYIHGIMDGEAIEMWRNGQLEEQRFILT